MRKELNTQLLAAACKVCTSGCIASYECGKSKALAKSIPLFGKNNICPLAKYEVEHKDDEKDFMAILANDPTPDDLFVLCKHCEHRDASQDTSDIICFASCYEEYCLDCPVQSCREAIQECMAEAQMS